MPFDDVEVAREGACSTPDTARSGAAGHIMKLTLARAAEFMQATGEFDPDAVASGYSIDSRTLQPGELFFAVRGERLDGHDYVEAALAKGAVAAVVETRAGSRALPSKSRLLVVDDTLAALQQLGRGGAAACGASR